MKTDAAMSGVNQWLWAVDSNGKFVATQRLDWVRGTLDWHRRAIVADVPDSAAAVIFGFSILGRGTLWVDDARVSGARADAPITAPRTQLGQILPPSASLLPVPRNLDFESWGENCP
jgi:hypothetical protein